MQLLFLAEPFSRRAISFRRPVFIGQSWIFNEFFPLHETIWPNDVREKGLHIYDTALFVWQVRREISHGRGANGVIPYSAQANGF